MNKGEEYKCEQVPVILYIPSDTVKLEIIAKILDENDEFIELKSVMKASEIGEARIAGYEWEGENVYYTLTDKGRKELENGSNNSRHTK